MRVAWCFLILLVKFYDWNKIEKRQMDPIHAEIHTDATHFELYPMIPSILGPALGGGFQAPWRNRYQIRRFIHVAVSDFWNQRNPESSLFGNAGQPIFFLAVREKTHDFLGKKYQQIIFPIVTRGAGFIAGPGLSFLTYLEDHPI